MGTILRYTLVIASGILTVWCSPEKVTRYETTAYKSASPENRLRIEQGGLSAGMSIEECKIACPKCQFTRKFVSTNNDYELWEVTGQGKNLHLHVLHGRIEKVSENIPQPTRKEKHIKLK